MSAEAKSKNRLRAVADGWANIMSGLGTRRYDKRMHAQISYRGMSEGEADNLYASSDIAARIVDTEPQDAMRQWITFSSDMDGLQVKVDQTLDQIHTATKLTEAYIWGRLYGGAAVLINVDDSKDLSQPLDLKSIRSLKSLVTLSRWELKPSDIDEDVSSSRYGEPTFYVLNPGRELIKGRDIKIHYSRLLLFYGVKLPQRQRIRNDFWGDSVLARAENAIRNYDLSNDAVATILQEFNIGVFKMKGLSDALLSNRDDDVVARMSTIALAKSNIRSVILDTDSEEFSNVGAHVNGIPEMVKTISQRLVVASGMPHTKLLGESPSGLGATGESEKIDWNDYISNQQELILRPKFQYLLEILLNSKQGPSGGRIPNNWSFEFKPLVQPNDSDLLLQRKAQAEIDRMYVEMQVLMPEEIRNSRFGSGVYSHETTIESDIVRPELEDLENG